MLHSATLFAIAAAALQEERLDPLVAPGKVSGHVHGVFGGSNFAMQSPTFDEMRKSKCTTCEVSQDSSAYWTPSLYFRYSNGSFAHVRSEGATVYYLQRGDKAEDLLAFPKGFRMIAGNPTLRANKNEPHQKANTPNFACLGSDKSETNSLPNYACSSGLRAQIFFPNCWDGKSLGTAEGGYTSHVAYSGKDGNGKCPKGFPKRLISLFIERLFHTEDFTGVQGEFVFSYGDSTGFGYHGDFINGWDLNVLQKAVNTCTSASGSVTDCSLFDVQKLNVATYPYGPKCNKSPTVNEVVSGKTLTKLPGCNRVSAGPASQSMQMCPTQPSLLKSVVYSGNTLPPSAQPITGSNTPSVLKSGYGFKYKGCFSDPDQWSHVLPAISVSGKMTVSKCLAACKAKNVKYCGLQYSKECYGGNTLKSTSKSINYGTCNAVCEGDSTHFCGGGKALTLYTKSSSSSSSSTRKANVAASKKLAFNAVKPISLNKRFLRKL